MNKKKQLIGSRAKIKRSALDNPDLPIEFIKDIIIAKQLSKLRAKPFYFSLEISK